MTIEKKFVRNYLSKLKFNSGKLAAFFIITLCLVASMFYWDTSYIFSKLMSASQSSVFIKGQYWRLFTTSFIHADMEHLLANSLMLFILTYFVTSFFGLFISLGLSFVMGMLTNFIVISQYHVDTTLVGASGVIYYLWGFWLIQYVFINRQMSLFSRLVRVIGVFLILLVPTTYSPQTSYLAHYAGFVIGIITGSIYFLVNKEKIRSYEFWEYRYILDIEEEDKKITEALESLDSYSSDSSRL